MKYKYKFRKNFIYILIAGFAIISCSEDDNASSVDPKAIDLVTGIVVAQDINSEGYGLGNPNIRMPKNLSSIYVYAYPNPTSNNLTVGLSQTTDNITDVWFVKANAQMIFQETDFEELLNENTYTTSEISQVSTHAINDLSVSNITLNLEGYEAGYYKVFIKTDESLYWDNVYIDNNGVDISELFESWDQEF